MPSRTLQITYVGDAGKVLAAQKQIDAGNTGLETGTKRTGGVFQSQFGSDPWLQPYTIDTVERLAKSGLERVAIVAPGFSADCLETLEELDIENRSKFLGSGGKKFAYVPCLNDSPHGMRVIEQIVRRELAGWV